jgi:hypothetical protein
MPKPKVKEEETKVPEQTNEKDPVTDDAEMNRLFEEESIDDLVNESPIVSSDAIEEDRKLAEETNTTEQAEKPAEKKETTEKEPKKEEQSEKSQETEEPETPEQETPEEPQKIKVGDAEYTPEELAAHKREFDNKTKWEEELRNKSIIAANLSEDQIQATMPYAVGDKDIPDQSAEFVAAMVNGTIGTEPIKLKDEEGYEVDITDQVKEKVTEAVKATLDKMMPVIDKVQGEAVAAQRKAVSTLYNNFMNDHPEYKIVAPNNMPLDQYMDVVQRTGNTHPDYPAITRLMVLVDNAKRMGYVGPTALEDAHSFLHGKNEKKVKTAEEKAAEAAETTEKIIEKQDKVTQEKPGTQVEVDDDLEFLNTLADPADIALDNLLKGK